MQSIFKNTPINKPFFADFSDFYPPFDKLPIKPFVLVIFAFFIGEVGIPFVEIFRYIIPYLLSVESVVKVVVAFGTEGHDVLLDSESTLTPADIMRVGDSRRTADDTPPSVPCLDFIFHLRGD